MQIWWTGVKYAYRQQNRHHFRLVSAAAERLPCSVDLLDRSRFPQFLRGHPQRGVALCGSSLHQAFRRFCRNCVFLRERRSGHRHSSWPRRPLSPQQQLCSDNRWSFHLLIASAAGSVESLASFSVDSKIAVARGCSWTGAGSSVSALGDVILKQKISLRAKNFAQSGYELAYPSQHIGHTTYQVTILRTESPGEINSMLVTRIAARYFRAASFSPLRKHREASRTGKA